MNFDLPVHRVVRKDAPITSLIGANSVDMAKTVEEVYNVIESFGEQGCISDEIQEILSHRSYGTVTSKYSWLKSKGYIKVDMRVRKGKAGRPQHIMWTYDNYKESNNERI
jgi:hypothetical protein